VRWFFTTFGFLLSWWGAFIVSALDSSLVFVLPFGVDALIIYLAARNRETFWIYPLVMTAGSVAGAALTFWAGVKIGDTELPKFVSERHLDRLRQRVKNAGAGSLAVSALLPPPFPLTPFVLVCGALDVNRRLFFSVFAAMRYPMKFASLRRASTSSSLIATRPFRSSMTTTCRLVRSWRSCGSGSIDAWPI